MKTKNKLLIAVVLCTLFLVALPGIGIAAAQEDEYVLDIYGNANEDDTIDMRDLTYVKLIFFGKKPETELSDAKYDGKINPLDFVQIKLIIVGKEKELTLVDDADRIVTVDKPVEKVIGGIDTALEAMRSLKANDLVVGVSNYVAKKTIFFPEFSKLPGVVASRKVNYEEVYRLEPDIFITYPPSSPQYAAKFEEMVDGLEPIGIEVLAFKFQSPEGIVGNTRKLGYVLDRREEAEEFIDWYEERINTIREQVADISEEDKPRLFFEYSRPYMTFNKRGYYQGLIETAGGINIAADLPSDYPDVDPEWVIEQNPDLIVHQTGLSKTACSYGVDDPAEMKALRDSIMNRPELATIDAVKNEKVYVITTHLTTSSIIAGTSYLAKWFHPEVFSDLDPQAVHQEYLTEWQGLDYDLDKHGVFVYPPVE